MSADELWSLLYDEYLPFRLYAEQRQGASIGDISQSTGLPEDWIDERIAAGLHSHRWKTVVSGLRSAIAKTPGRSIEASSRVRGPSLSFLTQKLFYISVECTSIDNTGVIHRYVSPLVDEQCHRHGSKVITFHQTVGSNDDGIVNPFVLKERLYHSFSVVVHRDPDGE